MNTYQLKKTFLPRVQELTMNSLNCPMAAEELDRVLDRACVTAAMFENCAFLSELTGPLRQNGLNAKADKVLREARVILARR